MLQTLGQWTSYAPSGGMRYAYYFSIHIGSIKGALGHCPKCDYFVRLKSSNLVAYRAKA